MDQQWGIDSLELYGSAYDVSLSVQLWSSGGRTLPFFLNKKELPSPLFLPLGSLTFPTPTRSIHPGV